MKLPAAVMEEVCSTEELLQHHTNLTPELVQFLCQAAKVCLHQNCTSPALFAVKSAGVRGSLEISWMSPTSREVFSHRNHIDTIENAAYAIGITCVGHTLNMVALGRTEELTGADWYIAPVGQDVCDPETGFPDLDAPGVFRLEVGGRSTENPVTTLKGKLKQLRKAESDLPGIAAVVVFQKHDIQIALLEEAE